ncbi:hypothetical protein Nepgr_017035 [Nepenthes gracilis]|uniref:Uncharacterized protein n=1 Tax=Nepenthes gracilis TaxID=150966 RepID=A0AAD3XSQ2_NEPGR|nr:hypothetical protein Nepgr_017035 [Nepenthes gracilis]
MQDQPRFRSDCLPKTVRLAKSELSSPSSDWNLGSPMDRKSQRKRERGWLTPVAMTAMKQSLVCHQLLYPRLCGSFITVVSSAAADALFSSAVARRSLLICTYGAPVACSNSAAASALLGCLLFAATPLNIKFKGCSKEEATEKGTGRRSIGSHAKRKRQRRAPAAAEIEQA